MPGYREANAALATPQPTSDVVGLRYTQELTKITQPGINLHYDSLLTINGDVNDTNHFNRQVGKIAQKCIEDTLDKINRDFVYHSY